MNVLHISHHDNLGGSGRAAYRIHESIRRHGIVSRMLVKHKHTKDPDVASISSGILLKLDRTFAKITNALSYESLFYPSSFALKFRTWYREADVLQIYNTHGNYFSHTALPWLARNKAIVWRLSDMWAFTGHCAYSYDCERWKTGCGQCPQLNDLTPLTRDTTNFLWRIKKNVYDRTKLHVVAPSAWIEALAKQSPLLSAFPIHKIHNGIDTTTFAPVNKQAARMILRLPNAKLVVLFVADFVNSRRKGLDILTAAIDKLPTLVREQVLLVILGECPTGSKINVGCRTHFISTVNDDRLLAIVYSATDVLVHAARAENLPNTILEGMSCGTPAIAFDTGGVREVVRNHETGFLLPNVNIDQVAATLFSVMNSEDLLQRLGDNARRFIEDEFSLELQQKSFVELYQLVGNT
jgi:glycosyltransferase involved in cell wall biosynthesis